MPTSTPELSHPSEEGWEEPSPASAAVADRLRETIERAVDFLLERQAAEGFWLGELEADSSLESDYIFYLHVLGRADGDRVGKLANYIRRRQLADGGWNIYQDGPSELDATVKGYLALKLAGDPIASSHMQAARACVLALGGIEKTNSFTRFYLALAGAVGWDMVPAVPPELVILPSWFPVNIYEMSSWTRAIVVPLTILYAYKPRWDVSPAAQIDELFKDPSRRLLAFDWDSTFFSWRNVFLAVDRAAKLYERLPWKPFRERALREARQWLVDHLDRSEGLGAIYPAMMNAVFALLALGHPVEDPITVREIEELARFEIEDQDTLRLQPCMSPVWDTAIAMAALEEAGLPSTHPALVRAGDWLLERQVLGSGDWQVKNQDAPPGGWVFEFRNDFYPDVDDSAFVLQSLQRVRCSDPARQEAAIANGLRWLLSMQNRDGGWGAFDRDNDRAILTQTPFADHNAMIDPSSVDVTARVIECLGRFGWTASDPVVVQGLAYIRREQTREGSWYGRWGVNYIYGTSGVLRALDVLRLGAREYTRRALAWLCSVQNDDGGFGETCASYADPSQMGQGPSTPSQTAWGLIGLLAAGSATDVAVERAVDYLLSRQNGDGSWDEQGTTGTGFPRVFYLKYHLYRHSFPLYGLARYQSLVQADPPALLQSRGEDRHSQRVLVG